MMSLFVPEIGIWEKVLRSVVVYLFVLLAFRFTGKRQVGQLTPFGLVLFGGSKLPELARSLGRSINEFKKGINEGAQAADAKEKDAKAKDEKT